MLGCLPNLFKVGKIGARPSEPKCGRCVTRPLRDTCGYGQGTPDRCKLYFTADYGCTRRRQWLRDPSWSRLCSHAYEGSAHG
jgi:hypothetical protein